MLRAPTNSGYGRTVKNNCIKRNVYDTCIIRKNLNC